MAPTLTYGELLANVKPGGGSCLTSVTDLAPAAGPHASIAPAKFADGKHGTYAYETRFDNGIAGTAVMVDSKQSQLNRIEEALVREIADGHEVLAKLPRVTVQYDDAAPPIVLSELELPHRLFDAHIRAGTVGGTPVTQLDRYIAARNASPADASALLTLSPASLLFGSWDSSRASKQGRWRSILVGEIIGFCARPADPEMKGGARIDPLGQRIDLSSADLKALAERQKGELSAKTFTSLTKGGAAKASTAGLGGIPPSLEALAGVACSKVVRSHVLSFAALRQLRFGAGPDGDAACRALLASLALAGLARSDRELLLRANCDLVESGETAVTIFGRGGATVGFGGVSVETADGLLAESLAAAESAAGIVWDGVQLAVVGDPAIGAGAVDDAAGES